MLLICDKDYFDDDFKHRYSDKVAYVDRQEFNQEMNNTWLIRFLEELKLKLTKYDIVYTLYEDKLVQCLQTLKMNFNLVYSVQNIVNNQVLVEKFKMLKCNKWIVYDNSIQYILKQFFDWIELPVVENQEQELTQISPTVNKNKLTLQELIDEDIEITEADVRDLKATQNKLKVGMLLQAKASLNRVLKLSTVLDKLYDKLVDRIDNSLDTTDTASLMYTTEYISKALSDTNQFIVSLISNEKIQNFFIIENNNVINVNNDRVDLAKRERIRKAAEIVMSNLDYFVDGDYDKIKNPNYVQGEVIDGEDGTDVNSNAESE